MDTFELHYITHAVVSVVFCSLIVIALWRSRKNKWLDVKLDETKYNDKCPFW